MLYNDDNDNNSDNKMRITALRRFVDTAKIANTLVLIYK